MTEAALVDDNMPPLDTAPEQETEQAESETPEASAPQADDKPAETDNVQKRINKITAEKHAEKRKADQLQREIDSLKAATKAPEVKAPALEDYDYDEAAFNAASISHQVREGVAAESLRLQNQGVVSKQAELNQQREQSFNAQVAEMTAAKPDYQEVIKSLPEFNQDTLDAIMSSDQGAELAYALGEKLDLADEIANASPMVAAMKLGELSAQLKQKPNIKTSAAPSPIEPVSSGGGLSKDLGEMSMEELYNS
jgi:hypothetical protein